MTSARDVADLIFRCYPAPIRRRWGQDLRDEIRTQGPRGWADAAVGAVRQWVLPSQWPGDTDGAVAALSLTLVAAIAMAHRLADHPPQTSLLTAVSIWTAVVGVVALVPRSRTEDLPRFARVGVRMMWLPATILQATSHHGTWPALLLLATAAISGLNLTHWPDHTSDRNRARNRSSDL